MKRQAAEKVTPRVAGARAARLSSDQRRRQLLACAISVFARQGFGVANHTSVAEAAEVSVPTVFVYFKTREALVDAVLDEVGSFYQHTLAAAINSGKPADIALIDLTKALTDSLISHPDYARILREWSILVQDEAWKRYLTHYSRMIDDMAKVISRGQAEGSIRSDLIAHDEAVIVYTGSWALIQMMEMGEPADRLDRLRFAIVQTVLNGPPSPRT